MQHPTTTAHVRKRTPTRRPTPPRMNRNPRPCRILRRNRTTPPYVVRSSPVRAARLRVEIMNDAPKVECQGSGRNAAASRR